MGALNGYVVAKPRLELLEVLAGIAAYQDSKWTGSGVRWGLTGAWCVVRQVVIIDWYSRLMIRHGRPPELVSLSRRTLNYHLAGLISARYIARTNRHQRNRRTKNLDLRPSLYKFTSLGRLWIKRHVGRVSNLVGPSAVQKTAQSGYTSSSTLKKHARAVDRTIHRDRAKPTKKKRPARPPGGWRTTAPARTGKRRK